MFSKILGRMLAKISRIGRNQPRKFGSSPESVGKLRRKADSRKKSPLCGELARDDRGVVTAETEAVTHDQSDFSLLRLIGSVVQIALGVGSEKIDGWWTNLIAQGK